MSCFVLSHRYVRIVGTHNTVNKVFHLVAFECMFTQRRYILEKGLLGKDVFLSVLGDIFIAFLLGIG